MLIVLVDVVVVVGVTYLITVNCRMNKFRQEQMSRADNIIQLADEKCPHDRTGSQG